MKMKTISIFLPAYTYHKRGYICRKLEQIIPTIKEYLLATQSLSTKLASKFNTHLKRYA